MARAKSTQCREIAIAYTLHLLHDRPRNGGKVCARQSHVSERVTWPHQGEIYSRLKLTSQCACCSPSSHSRDLGELNLESRINLTHTGLTSGKATRMAGELEIPLIQIYSAGEDRDFILSGVDIQTSLRLFSQRR